MINPLRRRNRALTVEQREEVQKLVFTLVQQRLAAAFGAEGMFTVSLKDPAVIDALFSQTVAESLAWEIAVDLAVPKTSRHQAASAFSISAPAAAALAPADPRAHRLVA